MPLYHEMRVAVATIMTMPNKLMAICIRMPSLISTMAKWAAKDRNTPRQKISRECLGTARVDRSARVAKGQRGATIDVPAQRQTSEVALSPMAASSGPWPRLRRGLWRGVWPNARALPHMVLLGGRVVSRSTHRLSIAPCHLRPLGQVGMARVDRAARVAKGQRGAAIDVPRAMGLLFHPTTPALSAATISKMPLKPLPPPRG
jgi:hypothetical protein